MNTHLLQQGPETQEGYSRVGSSGRVQCLELLKGIKGCWRLAASLKVRQRKQLEGLGAKVVREVYNIWNQTFSILDADCTPPHTTCHELQSRLRRIKETPIRTTISTNRQRYMKGDNLRT